MIKWSRLLTVAMALGISLLQVGCWSSSEINERAIITAAAIDKAETPGRVALTLQVINPSKVRQGDKDAVILSTTTGNTLFEASRLMQKSLSRKPFWGQIQVVLISEALAQEGITAWLDFLDRDFEPNRRVWLLIVRNALARQVLQAGFGFSPITSTTLDAMIDTARTNGKARVTNLNEFLMSLESPSQAAVTGFVELAEEKPTPPTQVDLEQRVILQGTAVLKQDRLVGYLGVPESRGVSWVIGKVVNSLVVVSGDNGPVSMEVVNARSKIKPTIVSGRPIMNVQVSVEAHVGDATTTNLDISKPQVNASVNRWLATSIKAEMEQALQKAQALHIDVFGFGSILCRAYPKVWKEVEDKWHDQVFPYLEVKFDVKAEVVHSGFLFKPAQVR